MGFTSYFYVNKKTLRNWLLCILFGCVYMFPLKHLKVCGMRRTI